MMLLCYSGSELLQLQSELTRLTDPACPVQVADYLTLRCQVTYLQYDVTVRHNLRRALIVTDNLYATKVRLHTTALALIIPRPNIPVFQCCILKRCTVCVNLPSLILNAG